MTTATRTAPHHNTLTCYTEYGCRLTDCVDRYRTWNRNRKRAQAAGTWQPYVDAELVRQRVLELHAAGFSIHRIVKLAGVSYDTLRSLTRHTRENRLPRRHCVTVEVAEKIFAIDPEEAAPARVDCTGTRRRIQALMACGWPRQRIAIHAGVSPENINKTVLRQKVSSDTARQIAATYERLRTTRPERNGVGKEQITKARAYAAANRWPPPKYWDETGAIDDPDFTPDYKVTRAEIIAEEATWLIETAGLSRGDVAERLGITRSYIDHAISRTAARTAVAA